MSVRLHVYDAQGYRALDSIENARALIERDDTVVWIDATERTDALVALLEQSLGLHPLVLEDMFCDAQVPKVEDYGSYVYMVLHGVRRDADRPEALGLLEVDIVLGKNWVFTHHPPELRSADDLASMLTRNPRIMQRGAAFIAHGVADKITDYFVPLLDRFQDEIDEIESTTVHRPSDRVLPHLFKLKRSLLRLRRVSMYQRDVLQRVSRGEFDIVPETAQVFFRDLYDHYVRVADVADSYRELVSSALEIYLSVTANRTNEIMKVLAVISTVMLPLTFIAGIYGMNFEHMPELKLRYGYPLALAMMATVAGALLLWFRRRGWL